MLEIEKANNILFNSKYTELLNTIEEAEKDRIYCKHNMEHFLSVARIMMILNFESNKPYDAEIVYATALLHDIGRAISNENHDIESVNCAKEILAECGFTAEEIALITESIGEHRKSNFSSKLSEFLCFADKKSRLCFECKASESCKWSNEKRTNKIYL